MHSASDVFQHTIQRVIGGVKGAKNISDDISIHGTTGEEHNIAMGSQSTYKSANSIYQKSNSTDRHSAAMDSHPTRKKFSPSKRYQSLNPRPNYVPSSPWHNTVPASSGTLPRYQNPCASWPGKVQHAHGPIWIQGVRRCQESTVRGHTHPILWSAQSHRNCGRCQPSWFRSHSRTRRSNHRGCHLCQSRLVLPAMLHVRAVELTHEWHQGLTKTKTLLRSKVCFSGIDSMAEIPCESAYLAKPTATAELPSGPCQNLNADFCGPLPTGEHLLVIIDEYSRYHVVEITCSTSAERSYQCLRKLCHIWIPCGYKNWQRTMPPFQGAKWKRYVQSIGVKHRKIHRCGLKRTWNEWKLSMPQLLRDRTGRPSCKTSVPPCFPLTNSCLDGKPEQRLLQQRMMPRNPMMELPVRMMLLQTLWWNHIGMLVWNYVTTQYRSVTSFWCRAKSRKHSHNSF